MKKENNDEKREMTPLEILTSVLLEYKKVLMATLDGEPDDEKIKQYISLYDEALIEFKNIVESDEIPNDEKIETVLLSFDELSNENRVLLINSYGNMLDMMAPAKEQKNTKFFEKILALYNMLVDIYSELDSSVTTKYILQNAVEAAYKFANEVVSEQERIKTQDPENFVQRNLDFGLSYRELTNVVAKIINEVLENTSDTIEAAYYCYEKMNKIERDFFIEQILLGQIESLESQIIRQQNSGVEIDEKLEVLTQGTRQLRWKIQKKYKQF